MTLSAAEGLRRENEALRERLVALSQASLAISKSLDFEDVLQGVVDAARELTGSRYGAITVLRGSGELPDLFVSGLSPEEYQAMWEMEGGEFLGDYLGGLEEPLRVADMGEYLGALGAAEITIPVSVTSALVAPIRHGGVQVGNVYLAREEPGRGFTAGDEDTVVMFASQAAMVIANARRYRDEQRARADLEALIHTCPVGVLVFDARTGAPKYVNPETRRILGGLLPSGDGLEHLVEVLVFRRGDGRQVRLREFPLAEALRTGETIRAEEIVFEVPGGGSVTALINATPIRSEDGDEVESVVVTLQDMAPLKELERLRAEFLAMASHELRTPLAAVRGSAATVLEAFPDVDPAETRQFLRIIVEQTDQMRGLITDLLDVARIETGILAVDPEPSDVTALVDQARNAFLRGGGRHDIRIDLAADLPAVMADRRRVIQVLANLISNAARHSHDSTTIRVTASVDDIYVGFSVIDQGRGVPEERLPHLFRKFSHIDGDPTIRQPDQMGLGLAICKGIVEAHGGRIWARSAGTNQGTTFTFTIPTADPAASPTPDPVRSSGRTSPEESPGERILALDDDPQALRHIRAILTKAGYTPLVTADPQEALRLMTRETPALVLLDLVLPGTDGIELMHKILGMADVPVIFVSAYGQDHNIERAFEMGADDYLVKPFSPTELLARIKATLRRREDPEPTEPDHPYTLGDLTVDYYQRRVTIAGQPITMTATEYNLLHELSTNSGRVLTQDHLLKRAWGPNHPTNTQTLRTFIKQLRRKLGDNARNPQYIFTEPRVGYRMAKPNPPPDTTT